MAYVTMTAISAGKAKINRRENNINCYLQLTYDRINHLILGEKRVVTDWGSEAFCGHPGEGEMHEALHTETRLGVGGPGTSFGWQTGETKASASPLIGMWLPASCLTLSSLISASAHWEHQ